MARIGGKNNSAKLSARALAKRLGKVRLLSLDVDGTLTDGGLYYSDDGRILRKFSVRDGVGIKRAIDVGVEVAFVSAGKTDSIRARAQSLGVRHVYQGADDKLAVIRALAEKLGIDMREVAHMGDDLNDLPVLTRAGLPLTVPGACQEALQAAIYVTRAPGGMGAVREICDLLVAGRTSRRDPRRRSPKS